MCAESRSLSSFSQRTTGLCSPVCRLCLGISSLPSVKCQHPECLRDDSGQAGRRNKGKRQSRPQRMGRRGRGWAAEGYFLYFFCCYFIFFFSKVIFYEGQIHSSEEQDKYRIGCHLCPLKKKSSHSCYSGRKLKIET